MKVGTFVYTCDQLIKFLKHSNKTINNCIAFTADLESDGAMLSTMLHCASRDAPILVWACTRNKGDHAMPPVEVANMLQLTHLVQPWKVSKVT